MVSYLQSVEKLVDKSIYGRGVKTFLEGGVVGFTNLTLDSWRKYSVKDLETETVLIPLLHLALSTAKWDKAELAIKESAGCSCRYFEEFGTCKHIVAVCAALEQEFIRPNKIGSKKQEIQSSLDTLFQFNNNQEQREWLNKIYQYFERNRSSLFPWISQIVKATSTENTPFNSSDSVNNIENRYQEFWEGLKQMCQKATEDFDQEKKLCGLIADSLITGSVVWWNFWLDILPSLHPTNLIKVLTELWFQGYTLQHLFQPELNQYIQDKPALANQILEKLQQYPNSEKLQVQFALQIKMRDWLEKNIVNLDPQSLIQMAVAFPDLLEQIELVLFNNLKIWADFLNPTGTEELKKIMQSWRTNIGDTMEYQNLKTYLKQNYPKRKSLWSDL